MANIFSPQSAYTYGNLGNTTSAYNIWGSKGNPYMTQGPTYTPGSGAPIVPRPIQPIAPPISSGGDNDGVDTTPIGYGKHYSDMSLAELEANYGSGYNERMGSTQPTYGITSPFGLDPIGLGLGLISPVAGLAYTGWKAYNMGEQDPSGVEIVDKSWRNKNWTDAPSLSTTTTTPQTFSNYSVDTAIQEQQQAASAQAQAARASGTGGAVGSVTFSDGSSANGLSDMSAGDVGSYSSAHSGDVGVTSYGDGMYGFTDADGTEVGWEDPGGDDSGGGDSGGGGSYIATATTQALGEEGLKVFEDWRDYMFTALPTFTSSFGRYRVTAPKIVEEIDKKENSKEIYEGIWNKYLKPIFDIIKTDKDSKKALKDYKVMVRELSNKYLKGDK